MASDLAHWLSIVRGESTIMREPFQLILELTEQANLQYS